MINAFLLNTKFLIASFAKLKFRTIAFSIFVPSAYFGTAAMAGKEVDDELKQINSDLNAKLNSDPSKDLTPLVELYLGLGQHNMKHGLFEKALEYYKKAEGLVQSGKVPKSIKTEDVYLGLSNTLKSLGNEREAAAYLEKSVDFRVFDFNISPIYDLSNYQEAAHIYEKHGDTAGAHRCYNKIVSLGEGLLDLSSPVLEEAKANRDRLQPTLNI